MNTLTATPAYKLGYRMDYNKVAHLYDQTPHRDKEIDPNLIIFLDKQSHILPTELRLLDMGCGTGNQLIANLAQVPQAQFTGLDLFGGMLKQAQTKNRNLNWVQANSANPPFVAQSFHYISNQFSFHHVHHKTAMLQTVFTLLKPGGQFVMVNICPREMSNWLCYQYFPTALQTDLAHFMPAPEIEKCLYQAGFVEVELDFKHIYFEQDLASFLTQARQRHHISQLSTISLADYQAGLKRLEKAIAQTQPPIGESAVYNNHVCLLTIQATKT